jgi:ATP-dependent Clp protease ATP-binding subunit ClpA
MFERFSVPARNVVIGAQAEARALRHSYVGTEHILLGLLDPTSDRAAAILREAGVERDLVVTEIERLIGRGRDFLGEADAEALRSIGIDLDSVVAAVEESFGPGALQPPRTVSRWRRRLRRLRPSRLLVRLRRPRPETLPGHAVQPHRQREPGPHLPFTRRSKKVLELSLRESIRLRHNYIGSEHILLGLLREGDGLAAQILCGAGLTLDDLRRRTLRALDEAA